LYGALLYIDLDNFKPLNDEHGHESGDLLLIEVGRRIRSSLREMDTVARIGGDEFVALIGQLEGNKTKSFTHAKKIGEKVLLALAEPYWITIAHGQEAGLTIEHHCTASIGVAVFSGRVTDPEVVLSMADVAMYEAKEAGRNQLKLNSSVI
jgi:diguanylate cyclase (GGDEF)-like protein